MKAVISFICLLSLVGCSKNTEDRRVLAEVNNYAITVDEFNEEFGNSPYAMNDTAENRRKFLDNLVNRKLILQEAQKKGLDRDARFLKLIERFWEQSLLRVALEQKSKEIAGTASVNEDEVKAAYDTMLAEGKTDKPLEEMYKNVKWELQRKKESRLMDAWMQQLQNNALIKTNQRLLGEDAQGGKHGTSQK